MEEQIIFKVVRTEDKQLELQIDTPGNKHDVRWIASEGFKDAIMTELNKQPSLLDTRDLIGWAKNITALTAD